MDILRNNIRQSEFLNFSGGAKIWSNIEALGVVDPGGGKSFMKKIDKLEIEEFNKKKVDRKEYQDRSK